MEFFLWSDVIRADNILSTKGQAKKRKEHENNTSHTHRTILNHINIRSQEESHEKQTHTLANTTSNSDNTKQHF
jgi:hypothetical protein